MFGTTLLVIVDDEAHLDEVRPLVAAVLDSGAEASADFQTQWITVDTASSSIHATNPMGIVAWRWRGPAANAAFEYELLSQMQHARIPLVITADDAQGPAGSYLDEGTVSCPVGTDPDVAWAMLAGLLNMAPVLSTLGREVGMLQAHHSGMAGQIDKIDEELRMAVKIQREFLPKKLPAQEQLGFDVMWRPAGYVSGDIYDVIRLDEHHFGLFIADAVGHGVPAALMTIYIKQSIQTKVLTPGEAKGYRLVRPGEALAGLNKAMIEQDAGSASLGTAAYGIIDIRTQELTIARAGHPAPLLLRADGTTELIEPDGAMLGVFPDEQFEEQTFHLSSGDRFLIYSDGFEVAFPGCGGSKRLANEHFATEFEQLRNGSGEEALDFLRSRLDEQAGSLNQRDDLTVICTTVLTDGNQQPAISPETLRSVA